MNSRFGTRVLVVLLALLRRALALGRRRAPPEPKRILIVHHQLLGDTLLMTVLVARLRERWPRAELVMTTPLSFVSLYHKRPYGLTALPYDPRDARSFSRLLRTGGFDLALVPGDNRNSWLAMALGARWIIGFAGDRPAYKNWMVDEFVPYSDSPKTWADMLVALAGGGAPAPYRPVDWPAPDCAAFRLPPHPYCVLHVGASSPLKLWQPEKWRALAQRLAALGFTIVWSGSKGEQSLVDAIDPAGRHLSFAGQLDLAQMWRLLQNAAMLVSLDTSIAHMGRLTGTPTVTLFGPGTDTLFGAGEFWRNSPYAAVMLQQVHCRDQKSLFKREIHWVRRCYRTPAECSRAICMEGIDVDRVFDAVDRLRPGTSGRAA
jgi:ADP-heptose:LPS heptosyltransferase